MMINLLKLLLFVVILLSSIAARGATVTELNGTTALRTNKIVRIKGDLDEKALEAFMSQLIVASAIPGDMLVLIDSPGGYEIAGREMIKAIEREKSRGNKVVCVVQHIAHSMAFNLLTHCSVRYALPKAKLIAHKVALVECGNDERLTANRLRLMADELDIDDAPYRLANAKAMHLTLADYDLYADQDHMWRAEDLIAMGYLKGLVSLSEN